eukprot:3570829-Pyramimonas_sp.AAC.1
MCDVHPVFPSANSCHAVLVLAKQYAIVKEHPLETKEVDDVLGGDEAWANVDRTEGMIISGPITARGLTASKRPSSS